MDILSICIFHSLYSTFLSKVLAARECSLISGGGRSTKIIKDREGVYEKIATVKNFPNFDRFRPTPPILNEHSL